MPLTDEQKLDLDLLRERRANGQSPESKRINEVINEIDLTGMTPSDLRSLCNPEFIVGIDFSQINTSGKFTTADMNRIAPGSIDVKELRAKLAITSFTQGTSSDVLDTQSGTIAVIKTFKAGADIEDLMFAKVKSQGTNMQFVNRGKGIDQQSVSRKDFPSKFTE